jgi:hypothetical protein
MAQVKKVLKEPDNPELPKEPIFEDRNYTIKFFYNDPARKFEGWSFVKDEPCEFTLQGGDDLFLDFATYGFHYKSKAFFAIGDIEGLYEEYVCYFLLYCFISVL